VNRQSKNMQVKLIQVQGCVCMLQRVGMGTGVDRGVLPLHCTVAHDDAMPLHQQLVMVRW
jgi:hypothetical protein